MRIAYADLIVGTAAEYLVCADLLLLGFPAFRADQGAAYDVACDVNGRLVRIQVKSTRVAKPYPQMRQQHVTGYTWSFRQGKGSNRSYEVGALDAVAFVALDSRRVAYLRAATCPITFQIPVSGGLKRPRTFDQYSFHSVVDSL